MMKTAVAVTALMMATAAWAAGKPNVVLVMADDIGLGDISFNVRERGSNVLVETPTSTG